MTSFFVGIFTAYFQRKHEDDSVGKICNFQRISCRISEAVQDMTKVIMSD